MDSSNSNLAESGSASNADESTKPTARNLVGREFTQHLCVDSDAVLRGLAR
jgi:hypothetical protein